jgi:hypothetical protein
MHSAGAALFVSLEGTTKKSPASIQKLAILELLPGFGPGTSSLPIDPTVFLVIPIHDC